MCHWDGCPKCHETNPENAHFVELAPDPKNDNFMRLAVLCMDARANGRIVCRKIQPESYKTYEDGFARPRGRFKCETCLLYDDIHRKDRTYSTNYLRPKGHVQSSSSNLPPPTFGAPAQGSTDPSTQQLTYGTGMDQYQPSGAQFAAPPSDYGTIQGSAQYYGTNPTAQPRNYEAYEAGQQSNLWEQPLPNAYQTAESSPPRSTVPGSRPARPTSPEIPRFDIQNATREQLQQMTSQMGKVTKKSKERKSKDK